MKASKSSSSKTKKSSRNSSSLSPKKGASGYDFCSRVEKCCVSWRECVQKWENLNSSGLEIATRIVNKHLENTSQENAESQKGPCHPNVNNDNGLQTDKEKLVQMFYSLKEVQEKMSSLTLNFEAIASLHQMKVGRSNEPIFKTWPINNYGKLAAMFLKELNLKEKLVGIVVRNSSEEDRTKLLGSLAAWLHQPYLEDEYQQELEIMLLETGLKTI